MLTIKGIMSYPHLFQPRSVNPGDDPKFSVQILIPKGDPQLANIQQLIDAEKANNFPSGFPHNGKVCLKDCAEQWPEDTRLHGYMVISTNTSADNKPHVVDANRQPVIDPSQVYPGATAWFAVSFSGYNKPVNKGVGAYINGVMLTGEEGPLGRLDNKPSADQMFANVGDTGAPVTAPAAAAPAAPNAAPAAPVAAAPLQMTAKAAGVSLEQYLATPGWTEELLIERGLAVRAPAAPAATPAPPTAPAIPPAPNAAPTAPTPLVMTAKANGVTLEQYLATPGWTEELLLEQGLAIRPSFA